MPISPATPAADPQAVARVLITGASGFVGRWLAAELAGAGHEVIDSDPSLDVRDHEGVSAAVTGGRPQAIAHLAAVAYAPDASAQPETAFEVAVAGTTNVIEAARLLVPAPVILVSGSSEAYGAPTPADLPLVESSPLRARSAYGLSKLAQESVALAGAQRYDLRVVTTRSFNHTGPGQRPEFVVPALARRVLALARGQAAVIPVGNIDVRRDLSDVRDVVRAYRLLLEAALGADFGRGGAVVNVCSGESVAIRWIAEELCRIAAVEPRLETDPSLVRQTDPPDIRGDHGLLTRTTGWQPRLTLAETLRAVWGEVAAAASCR